MIFIAPLNVNTCDKILLGEILKDGNIDENKIRTT